MKTNLPSPFPNISLKNCENPAMVLFGHRLMKDQSILEYLTEFLAVIYSQKKFSDSDIISDYFPPFEILMNFSNSDKSLAYKLPIKLNLKLFAFLSTSRIDTRHVVHKEQYRKLVRELQNRVSCSGIEEAEVGAKIEEFLRGLQGAGFGRTWCAQSFYPITSKTLLQETIWNESIVKREKVKSWDESINNFKKYYSISKHRFMARGGEVLYLQICNILSCKQNQLDKFANMAWIGSKDRDLEELHRRLMVGFSQLYGQYTEPLNQLFEFIEHLDTETSFHVNEKTSDWLECEWCAKDSWQEGYLFVLEICRILEALLDPAERLDLLMFGCALQVLRTLFAQSIRYSNTKPANHTALGYAWLFSFNDSPPSSRLPSQKNLKFNQQLIWKALRHEKLQEIAAKKGNQEKMYKEADSKYGHKLFLSLGKKLEIIVPRTGPGARFIMTDELLRYLVLTLISPGEKCTYDVFLERIFWHHGIAIEGQQVKEALAWSEQPVNQLAGDANLPIKDMLRAGGFLTEFSDGYSIVANPFGKE